jgi:LPS sulfotransferase NodH
MIPFIVAGHPRSGSTLLKEAIEQHHRVRIYSELFHRVESERKNTHYIGKADGSRVFYPGGESDAMQFLRAHVWSPEAAAHHAVGFKLFAERVQCPGTERLFVRLKAEVQGLRVIHIIRRNFLDMWVSRKKAEQTGVWRVPSIGVEPPPKGGVQGIRANPENLLQHFNQLESATHFLHRHFSDGPYLKIDYGQLIREFQAQMERVFRFLDVEVLDCRMTLRKQNTGLHKQFIQNYDELKQFFQSTKFRHFFVE